MKYEYYKTVSGIKQIFLVAAFSAFVVQARAQDATKYIARDGSEVKYFAEELSLKLPPNLKPLFNYPIRDVAVCRGPDSTYYLTGTTGDPDMWAVTSDIRVEVKRSERVDTGGNKAPHPLGCLERRPRRHSMAKENQHSRWCSFSSVVGAGNSLFQRHVLAYLLFPWLGNSILLFGLYNK